MKKVCVYEGQPLKIKPLLADLKQQGIPYQLKSKFTLRVFRESKPVSGLATGNDSIRRDYAGPPEHVRLLVPEEHEQAARQMLRELLG